MYKIVGWSGIRRATFVVVFFVLVDSSIQTLELLRLGAWVGVLALWLDCARQGEGKCAALAERAFDPDPATVGLDQLAADRKAQSATLLLATPAGDLPKLLEDQWQVFRRDANAGIAH